MEQDVQLLTWTIVLCTDSSAALGFVKRKGARRRTRHVETMVFFMQAWAMEPGQQILKVHGDTVNKFLIASQRLQRLEQLIAKLSDFDRCSNLSNIDEGVRKIAAHQITVSDLNTFTITFPVYTRMKFVMSGDELISMKETFGLCEGRAEQHSYIPVRAT